MTIIALYGSSCSGKTAIGQSLSKVVNYPLRSCGNAVRDRAKEIGVEVNNFPAGEHQLVDSMTRVWCAEDGPRIVEGRYLDQVLADFNGEIDLIQLIAEKNIRVSRCAQRERSRNIDERWIDASDLDDADFRASFYTGVDALKASFVLDTTRLTIIECVHTLISRMR